MQKETNIVVQLLLDKNAHCNYGHLVFAFCVCTNSRCRLSGVWTFQMIDALAPFIDSGKVRGIQHQQHQQWKLASNEMLPEHKAIRHTNSIIMCLMKWCRSFNATNALENIYLWAVASFGALHWANRVLKAPWHYQWLHGHERRIWFKWIYKRLLGWTGLFQQPHALCAKPQRWGYLEKIKASHHIHIYTAAATMKTPMRTRRFSQVLWDPYLNDLDIWGLILIATGLHGEPCCLMYLIRSFRN